MEGKMAQQQNHHIRSLTPRLMLPLELDPLQQRHEKGDG